MQRYPDCVDLSIVKAEPIETSEAASLDHWADLEVQEEIDPTEQARAQEKQKENNQPVDNQSGWPSTWFKCKLCMYMSQTQELLLNHTFRKHTLVDSIFYLCGFCNYRSINEELFKEHLQGHLPAEKEEDDSWKWNMYYDFVEKEESKNKRQRRNQRRLSRDQTKVLESVFQRHHYITRKAKAELAAALLIEEGQVSTWFSNRRHKLMKCQY